MRCVYAFADLTVGSKDKLSVKVHSELLDVRVLVI